MRIKIYLVLNFNYFGIVKIYGEGFNFVDGLFFKDDRDKILRVFLYI